MKRKSSVWKRTPIKKHKAVVQPLKQPSDKKSTPKLSQEAMLKNCISQTSQLSMHVQQLLDECFALAPNQLRGYLLRADVEIRDLLRLLTSKIGSTPDPDILPVDYFKEDLEDVPEKHDGSVNTAVSKAMLVDPNTCKSRSADMLALSASSLLEELAESSNADLFSSEIKTLTGISRRYTDVASKVNN